MRVQIVDPPAYTPPYDHALSGALARAGAEVELITSRFSYGPVPREQGYEVREFFYRRSSREGIGPRRRRLLRAVEHVPDMLRYRRAAEAADVVHYMWLPIPALDRHLLAPKRPRVYTMHWRLPSARTALAGALFLHRRYTVESGGDATRPVGWVQSSAMLVRRQAALEVGGFDPNFFVYSDETDFCKRLSDAGWRILYVPSARAIHHDQMAQDAAGSERRIVEYHRNRDLYLRKHLGRTRAFLLRPVLAWPYLLRALAALVLPGHSPRRYWLHARQALMPGGGEGIREAADAYNRRIGS